MSEQSATADKATQRTCGFNQPLTRGPHHNPSMCSGSSRKGVERKPTGRRTTATSPVKSTHHRSSFHFILVIVVIIVIVPMHIGRSVIHSVTAVCGYVYMSPRPFIPHPHAMHAFLSDRFRNCRHFLSPSGWAWQCPFSIFLILILIHAPPFVIGTHSPRARSAQHLT